ncbi:ABC transporter permease [Isachenkonia alkalipeptolytica]|nr:ABC transporter permease [Isachenkonia alkalipeptolytica]
MKIFKSNIKRILRDKASMVSMILVPVVFISLYFIANTSGGSGGIRIGIHDEDQTAMTEIIHNNLEENFTLQEVTLTEIQGMLFSGDLDYAIHFPEGYTEKTIQGETPGVEGYESMDNQRYQPFIFYFENYLLGIHSLAGEAQGEEALFYQGLEFYDPGMLGINYETTGATRAHSISSMGFLVMGILFFSIRSTTLILKDRKTKIFQRILTSPLSIRQYMLENILSFALLILLQIGLILVIVAGVFRVPMGPSLINLLVMLFLFGLSSISLGISMVSLGKDQHKMTTLTTLLATPMLMLGGVFWPVEIMPEPLQNIGMFIPVTWAMKGIEGVMYGSALGELWLEALILIGFTLLFFLLGSWRREDVAQ